MGWTDHFEMMKSIYGPRFAPVDMATAVLVAEQAYRAGEFFGGSLCELLFDRQEPTADDSCYYTAWPVQG
jgi:hypothetical protein